MQENSIGMTPKALLTSTQAAALAHISYRQLDYWLRTGVVPAPTVPADGTGTLRMFGFLDLLRVRMVALLRQQGAKTAVIRRALAIIEEEWRREDPMDCGRMAVIDDCMCLDTDPEALWYILNRRGMARRIIVLNLGGIAQVMAERVRALQAEPEAWA